MGGLLDRRSFVDEDEEDERYVTCHHGVEQGQQLEIVRLVLVRFFPRGLPNRRLFLFCDCFICLGFSRPKPSTVRSVSLSDVFRGLFLLQRASASVLGASNQLVD